jgi:cytochrome b subunit of formate dehydrogenase
MKKLNNDGSVIPVLMYLIGLIVFGFIYWLLGGILDVFRVMNIEDSTTYTVGPFLWYIFAGLVVVYLLVGGIWLIRTYNEKEQQMGGGFQ